MNSSKPISNTGERSLFKENRAPERCLFPQHTSSSEVLLLQFMESPREPGQAWCYQFRAHWQKQRKKTQCFSGLDVLMPPSTFKKPTPPNSKEKENFRRFKGQSERSLFLSQPFLPAPTSRL